GIATTASRRANILVTAGVSTVRPGHRTLANVDSIARSCHGENSGSAGRGAGAGGSRSCTEPRNGRGGAVTGPSTKVTLTRRAGRGSPSAVCTSVPGDATVVLVPGAGGTGSRVSGSGAGGGSASTTSSIAAAARRPSPSSSSVPAARIRSASGYISAQLECGLLAGRRLEHGLPQRVTGPHAQLAGGGNSVEVLRDAHVRRSPGLRPENVSYLAVERRIRPE